MNTFRIKFRYKGTDNQIHTKMIDIGLIQSIEYSYSIKNTKAGIPSQPSQNAFIMDYGVTRSHSFKFRRVNPQVIDDTLDSNDDDACLKWSNGFWEYIMKKYIVNRWQTETDGCKIQYLVPNEDKELYTSIPETNVYITSFSSEQESGDVSTLSGTIKFMVGATNLVKVVAKHTIIYDANYDSYDSGTDDPTNYVNVTNNDSASAMSLPSSWKDRAVTEHSITVGTDADFRWCVDAIPQVANGQITSKTYTAGELISFDSEVKGDILTLYAIYDINHIPS